DAPPNSKALPKLNIAQELGLAGDEGGTADHVSFSGAFRCQENTRKGSLSLTATIEPGWHVYSVTQLKGGPMASKIKVAESPDFKVLGPFQPDRPPHIQQLEIYKVPVEEHEGTVTWSAPIEIAEGVDPQSLTIGLTYSGQVCSDVCIPIFNQQALAKFAGFTPAPEAVGEYRPDPLQSEVFIRGHLEPAAAKPGSTVNLVITATPNPGWHIYAYAPLDPNEVAKPTLIHVVLPTGWKQGEVQASSDPIVKLGNKAVPTTRYYDQAVTWRVPITIPADAETGERVLTGYLGMQTCTDKNCRFPDAVEFRVSLPVAGQEQTGEIPLEFLPLKRETRGAETAAVRGYADVAKLAAASTPANAESPAQTTPTTKPVDLNGLLIAAAIGFLGGIILNFMPCVLPVIGLKILSFAQQGGQHRGRIFALNLWFFFGIMAVFMALATLAAVVNLFWGEQFTYTWFKVALILVTFAMALSFLGVWEIPIPGFSQSMGKPEDAKEEGLSGAFLKGIFTTLLATPCSGPLLGPLFTFVAGSSPIVAYVLFGSIGLGMGMPYLVIGAAPRLVRWLPKPGAWMETFKQLMGFVLLFTVVYLFWSVPSYYVPTLAAMIGVWLACWWIGRVPVYEETNKQVWAWIGGCAAAVLVGMIAFTMFGPKSEAEKLESIAWLPYSEEQLAQEISAGKTVMIDFTANWCPTCQLNTHFAIETPKIKALLEKNGVVPMLADWTEHSPEIKAKLQELKSASIPFLAIYPAGQPAEVIRLQDVISESQLAQALEKAGPSKTAATASTGAVTAEALAGNQPSG
ncbi:MAG TPA: protein-disulfide reductase DsbD domain-containing protein, partial [Pirellulaceae bacterium]|nr:protein-disulfide reductase DsbD domain-containing protein [Pirellulaceae bacterium]